MQEIIYVKGMHCKSCSQLIEGEIGDLNGVESVKVDLASGKATVKFNQKDISIGAIKSKIESMGYSTL